MVVNLEPAKQIPGLEFYPKMVYPGTEKGEMPGSGTGVQVANEDEEKWVMTGNKLEDFGKPPKEGKKPAAGWDAKPEA